MDTIRIRKADFADENVYEDTCLNCGVKCVRAYLTAAIVKVPLCLVCLEELVAEGREALDDCKRTCDFCKWQTLDDREDARCSLTNNFTSRGETCPKFERNL